MEVQVRERKPAVGFIFLTLVLDVLGFGLLIPIGPRLVMSLLHGGQGGTHAEAGPVVSALMSTYYAMSFLFAPLLGALSDKVGRRPVILISLLGSGLDYFAQALAPNLAVLFVTRALNGLSGASFTVASAYIADITPREKRAAAFGMLGAAFGLGFVIGPLLGGYLGSLHWHPNLPGTTPAELAPGHESLRLPFLAAGVLTLINWLYGLFVLPESLPRDRRGAFSWKRANPVGALHGLGRYPLVAGLAVSLFMLNLAQFGLHSTWALYTDYRYGWTPKMIGLSLGFVGIGAAVVQGGLSRKLIPALGEKRSVLIGICFGIFAFVMYGSIPAPYGWLIYVVILVASLGSIGQPAAQAMISHTVRPDEQGQVQGTLASLQSIAGIIGPLMGGNVFSYFISDRAPAKVPGASFYVSAALSVVALLAAAYSIGRWGKEEKPPPEPGSLGS